MLFSESFNTNKSYMNFGQGSEAVAVFYLPKYQFQELTGSTKYTQKMKNVINKSLKNINFGTVNFDRNEFAQNAGEFCKSDFAADYAGAVLGNILKNKKISSQKLIETFLNCYAPILNMKLVAMGYNNLEEFKNAISNGSVNTETFIRQFSDGLKVFKNNSIKNFSNRYEEIQIDVIKRLEFKYSENSILKRRANYDVTNSNVVNRTDNVLINLVGHIHNKNADLVKSNNIISKLEQTMSAGKRFADNSSYISNKQVNSATNPNIILRIGKDIFEYCRIIDLKTDISRSYDDLRLDVTLLYNLYKDSNDIAADSYLQLL